MQRKTAVNFKNRKSVRSLLYFEVSRYRQLYIRDTRSMKRRRRTLMTCNTLLRSATHTHTQCTHAFGTLILNTYQEYKSKTWKCLTESDSQLPLPALPHRQTGKFLKANSSQTQTIIQNAQGNKHTAAAELRWVSKKISGNIKERHVCANLHWFYYFAEIIIFAHQTLKLE